MFNDISIINNYFITRIWRNLCLNIVMKNVPFADIKEQIHYFKRIRCHQVTVMSMMKSQVQVITKQ